MPKKAKEVELWEGDEVETTGKLTESRQHQSLANLLKMNLFSQLACYVANVIFQWAILYRQGYVSHIANCLKRKKGITTLVYANITQPTK